MSSPPFNPKNILAFYQEAEKLKTILRHSWLSNSERQESVAEHTWMMALMAMVLMPHFEGELDEQKVLRMIILHDLAEALTEDLPVWEGIKDKEGKLKAERQAIEQMFSTLDATTRDEFMAIWEEYERRDSLEARFVKMIDTLDVVAQHNTASIDTWDNNDYLWQLSPVQDAFFDLDENLRKLKDELDEWSITKVKKNGELEKLDQEELEKKLS